MSEIILNSKSINNLSGPVESSTAKFKSVLITRFLFMIMFLLLIPGFLIGQTDSQKSKDTKRIEHITNAITSNSYATLWGEPFYNLRKYPEPFSKYRKTFNNSKDSLEIQLDLLFFNDENRYRSAVNLTLERGTDSLLSLTNVKQGNLIPVTAGDGIIKIIILFLIGAFCTHLATSFFISKSIGKQILAFFIAIAGVIFLLYLLPAFFYIYWNGSGWAAFIGFALGLLGGGFRLIMYLILAIIEDGEKVNLLYLAVFLIGLITAFNDLTKKNEGYYIDKMSIVAFPDSTQSLPEYYNHLKQRLRLCDFNVVHKTRMDKNLQNISNLNVNRNGDILFENKVISIERLDQILVNKRTKNPDIILNLTIARQLSRKYLIEFFRQLQRAGTTYIVFDNDHS